MNRLSARVGTVLLLLLAAPASQVRADYLNWTYTTSPNVPSFIVGSPHWHGEGAIVSLTGVSTAQPGAATIPLLAITTSTSATIPITVNTIFTPYLLNLTITDSTTHDYGIIHLSGVLTGYLTATKSSVVNTLAVPNGDGVNGTMIDRRTYIVTIPPVTLPPTGGPTYIMATVSAFTVPTPPSPEPSSLLLACLGLPSLGLAGWFRRRNTRNA